MSHSAGIWEVEMRLRAAGYDKQLIAKRGDCYQRSGLSGHSLNECVQILDLLTVCTGVALPYQGRSASSWIEAHVNKRG